MLLSLNCVEGYVRHISLKFMVVLNETLIFLCFCCWLLCTLFPLSGFIPLGFPEKVFNEADAKFPWLF
jgi:hypothetical protein